jgi:phospholipid transport system substrate-binding protein
MPLATLGRRRLPWLTAAWIGGATWARHAAADPAAIAPIQQLCDALLSIMKAGAAAPFAQRFATLAQVVDSTFNLPVILQVSVGAAWSGLPPDQQTALQAAFRQYTIASYVNSFDNYTGQRFEVSPQTRNVTNGELVVQTKIIPTSGESHELDYVMRQDGGAWRVVDVLADGSISRVAVQRSDFRRLLATGGAPALMTSLQHKTADLSAGAVH